MGEKRKPRQIFGVPLEIIILGIVSFLTDISSEMIFSVFSVFFTVILGASQALLGLVEGLSDFAASSLDFVSGYLSDKTGKRKPFAVFGYGFSTAAKSIILFLPTVFGAALFRVVERLGKSIRGAPRDALISTISSEGKTGASFGIHKMLDKAGAILGPFVAYLILKSLGETPSAFRFLFAVALVPAILSVLVLVLFVKDRKPRKRAIRANPFQILGTLSGDLKRYLLSSAVFSLSYFSFSFLLLKAYLVGFSASEVVLLYATFNVSFFLFAVPLGKLGDKIGRKYLVAGEYVLYSAISIGFLLANSRETIIILFLLFGIFYTLDEAQSKAYISDTSAKETRASAIGLYSFVTGLVYLPASAIAGLLWKYSGPSAAFAFAAVIPLFALGIFLFPKRDLRSAQR
ncbi:MAG: MFS transporter [archaeon]